MTLTIRTMFKAGRIHAWANDDGKRRSTRIRPRGCLMESQCDAAMILAARLGYDPDTIRRRPALMESSVSISTAWEVSK